MGRDGEDRVGAHKQARKADDRCHAENDEAVSAELLDELSDADLLTNSAIRREGCFYK
jgi:hypothetical protein